MASPVNFHELGCDCSECLDPGFRRVPADTIERIMRHNAIFASLRRKTELPDDDIYPYIPRFQQPEGE